MNNLIGRNQRRDESSITINGQLKRRESEILQLIAYEYSNREIANRLYIRFETANAHRKRILKKLAVRNTAGMACVGIERKLLSAI